MPLTRPQLAARVAAELRDGEYVNLGSACPRWCRTTSPTGVTSSCSRRTGFWAWGPIHTRSDVDPDLINAGKETVTVLPGASYFDSATSFGMIRGGHIDVAILGAMQVSTNAATSPTG